MNIPDNTQYAVVFNDETGKLFFAGNANKDSDFDFVPEGFSVLFFPTVLGVDINTQAVDLETKTLIDKVITTPMPVRYATWQIIKERRIELMESPVETSYGFMDADQASVLMMETAIEHFDVLPTVIQEKLTWKKADNTFIKLTKLELIAMRHQVVQGKALRGSALFSKAEQFNQMDPKPTLEFISDIINWIEP